MCSERRQDSSAKLNNGFKAESTLFKGEKTKMKNNLFKKSIAVVMTALMLLSCWVFVPEVHEHSEAEAAALETASALYNKTQLNGINTNIDTTMTTVIGKFKDPNMEGDENASFHVSQYGSQHYKNIYYSPTVTSSMPAAKMTGISNIDSVMVYYPETVMIYDGTTKPQMGVVACVDGGNYAVRALSVYISANANGLVVTDHWKGSTTANLAHIINMHNGSYQMSNDGTEHSSYKHNTKDHGEWYFYASDLRFDGTLASDEFVRTITPTWGFYGAYYRYYWLGNQTGSLTKITDVADANIYVMNVKAYRDLLTTISTDKTNISNKAGQYTPESVKTYVNAANAILNLNPKNVSQDPSAVKTWGSNMSTALTNYNTAKNGLKNREYEVTYDNMFSLADWKYSASSEKANVTTDLTNGKVTVQNTNASGEYVTPHSGNSTNANTRITSNYAMPVVGGQEYVFKYTTDHADTQMFAFFYDANGGHTGTYGAYNLTVKNGTGQATFKAPDNATQMEIRFDNNTGATTANFWDIMIYPAAVKTEKDVDSWTNRPIRTLYTYNASVGTLPTPVRPGYIFDGWKEDTDGDGIGDAAISGNVTKSRVLYSSWKPGTMDVGYDNLFSLAAWANTKSNGKGNAANTSNIVVDLDAGTIAVSGKSDAYTTYGGGSDQYHIPVTAGETYIFDYDVTSTNGTYQAFVFFYNDAGSGVTGAIYNGSAQSNAHIGLYNGQPITFTVPSGCTKIGFRVGICGDAEGTATYSNIGIYKKSSYDAYAKDYTKVREAFLIGDTKNLMTPTRAGYNFEGWTLADGTKVTTTVGFNANTVVYANWSRNFTVTYYDGDNTTVLATKTVKEGETVGALPTVVPTKDTTAEYSYEFSYWYANGTKFTKDTVITADLSVFPVFNNIAHSDFTFTLVKASTCTANATVTKKCGNCSYNFGNVTYNPAEDANAASHTGWLEKGHDYSAGEILADSSTGNTDADTHSIKCARYDTCGSVEKVSHNWAGSDPQGATCTTPGTIEWSCPCGAEKTTTGDIAPDAHSYDETKGTPNGDSKTHTVVCSNNAAHTKTVACTDADNNCVCDICGQELIHVYDQQTETYPDVIADCYKDATFFYTCKCGKKGTETWTKTGTMLAHEWAETETFKKTDAVCETGTVYYKECSLCHASSKDITGETWTADDATGHDYSGEIRNNNNGTHSYLCANGCGTYGYDKVKEASTNCIYGAWDITGADKHVKTCTECSYKLEGEHSFSAWVSTDLYKEADGQHSKECSVCKKVVTEDCTYTEESFAETCTTDGFTRYSCNDCGHNYKTNIIGKTGHNYTGDVKSYGNGQHSFLCKNGCNTYGYEGIENARTTCTYEYTNTASGKHTGKCSVCSYSYTADCSDMENDKNHNCDVCGAEGITAHIKGEETKENFTDATCTTGGSYDNVTYCTVCGVQTSRETITVSQKGHTAGEVVVENEVDATCTTDGSYDNVTYCTVCGVQTSRETITVSQKGHTAGEVVVENEVDATCTTDGSYDNVTYCTVCGVQTSRETITVPQKGHTPGAEATCTTAQTCTVCGTTLVAALKHDYKAVVTDPTCTTDGYTTYTCTRGDHTYTADTVTAPGHTAGADATCTEDQTCTVCGEVLVEALGHIAGADATCTENQTCTVCGEVLVEASGHTAGADATCTENQTCTVCGEVLVEALGHTAGADATCTTAQTCTVCNEVLVEALGHTAGADATCTTAQTCTVCGEVLVGALGHTAGADATCTENQTCTVCGEVLVGALGHTAGADATCTEDQTCTVCGEVLVGALGHIAGADATCTEDQTCTVCGEVLVDALGHKAGADATCTEDQTCTVCGEVLVEASGHTAGADATCTENQTCTVCGEVLVEALGHTAGADATCTTAQTCTVCGEELKAALQHDYKAVVTDPTCTTDGYTTYTCTKCGDTYTDNTVVALGHTWTDADCTTPKTCSVCGETEGKANGHKMTDYGYTVPSKVELPEGTVIAEPTCKKDGLAISYCENEGCTYYDTMVAARDKDAHKWGEEIKGEGNCTTGVTFYTECSYCGTKTVTKVEVVPHELVLVAYEPANCTTEEIRYYMCSVCGYGEEEHIGKALGHDWAKDVIEKEATCGQTGRKYSICSRCNAASEKVEIPRLGHVWETEGFNYAEYMAEHPNANILYVEASDATCTYEGYNGYYKCFSCSYDQHLDNEWRKDNVIAVKAHEDKDGDNKCDVCNAKLYGDDSNSACGCICHKENWFSKLIYKILCFFWKLFGIGKSCECGTVHY